MYVVVEKADLWRYLVVHLHGGLYIDSDMRAAKPIDQWFAAIAKTIGVPQIFPSLILADEHGEGNAKGQFMQWVFYAARGHPFLYKLVRDIRLNFLNELAVGKIVGDAEKRTGPAIFTRAAKQFLDSEGKWSFDEFAHGGGRTNQNMFKIKCIGSGKRSCIIGRWYLVFLLLNH